MKRILVIITNPQQASYRVRIEALQPALAERGFKLIPAVRPKQLLARRMLLGTAGQYDAVILQRKLLDPADARVLRQKARRVLYDIDDAVMFHAHRVGLLSRWRTNRRFKATTAILDHVVAGNEFLAEIFRQRGRSVTVIPTSVDPAHYKVKQHDLGEGVRLVWIGSHSTLPYLQERLPSIEAAAERVPGLRLITIADQTVQNAKLPVEHVEWSTEAEADALVRGDIGIAPTPDDQWTRGKCGFKIIQYMAAGLPVIASPVGANADIVTLGTGMLATTPARWTEAIEELAGKIELRRSMGRAGRERVERHYSVERAVDVWANLLAE